MTENKLPKYNKDMVAGIVEALENGHDVWWSYAGDEAKDDHLYYYCRRCFRNLVINIEKRTYGGTMITEKCDRD